MLFQQSCIVCPHTVLICTRDWPLSQKGKLYPFFACVSVTYEFKRNSMRQQSHGLLQVEVFYWCIIGTCLFTFAVLSEYLCCNPFFPSHTLLQQTKPVTAVVAPVLLYWYFWRHMHATCSIALWEIYHHSNSIYDNEAGKPSYQPIRHSNLL